MKGALQFAICSGIVLSVSVSPPAFAAKNPAKTSAKCRQTIAKAVSTLAKSGLKTLEQCHKKRNKGKGTTGDCNTIILGATTPWGRTETLQTAKINGKCKEGEEVLANYTSSAFPAGSPVGVVFPAMRGLLEESSTALQGSPSFTGDKKVVKSSSKCHAAIGKARTAIVLDILKSAQKCQKKVDKSLSSFAGIGIDPSCIAGPGKKANKAIGKMRKQCQSFSDGASLGTCSGFPDCVVEEATRTGQTLAAFAYGGATTCGNAVLELGELCDDGGESATCDVDCSAVECGDTVVNMSAGEECDLGSSGAQGNRDDGPCNTQCLNAVCGDGILVAGLEECDDGNAVAGDGCTNCVIDGTTCGAGGLLATLVLDTGPDGQGFAQFGLAEMGFTYPGALSLPGSSVLDIIGRFPQPDLSQFFQLATNDQAASRLKVTIAAAGLGGMPREELQIAKVLFDCAAGSEVRPGDFACEVTRLLDPLGNDILDTDHDGSPDIPEGFRRCFVSALELP